MFVNSIKKRVFTCLMALLLVFFAAHFLVIAAGVEPYTLPFYILPPLLSIIPVALLGFYMCSRIIGPVDKLSAGLKEIIRGVQPDTVKLSGEGEMGAAVGELKVMLQGLHHRDALLMGLTDRLQAQNRELIAINERLVEADRLKTQFLAGVTHELKTPLSIIKGYSEMMLDGVGGEPNPTHRDFSMEMVSSAIHLEEMINDVLDYSKAQAGTLDVRFERFDLPGLTGDVERAVHPLLAKKKHSFEKSLLQGLEDVVADRKRIKQVMMNLLSNAAKFTRDGGRIKVETFRGEGVWGVSVTDNGIGINEEEFSRMFLPFSQLNPGYAREFEGTGLGLAICKKIIEMHGGRIWVESEHGKGSSFYFTIPDSLRPDM